MSTEKYPDQSPVLTEFYRAIWAKIEAIDYDKPDEYVTSKDPDIWFSRNRGLCWNLWKYCNSVAKVPSAYERARAELDDSFSLANFDEIFPFNNGSFRDYNEEGDHYALYKNEKRLDWIKDHM